MPRQPSVVPRPNVSVGGSATSSPAAERPRSRRPAPCAAGGTPSIVRAPPTSSPRSVCRIGVGPRLGEQGGGAGDDRCRGARPAHRSEHRASVGGRAGLGGGEADAGREQLGLDRRRRTRAPTTRTVRCVIRAAPVARGAAIDDHGSRLRQQRPRRRLRERDHGNADPLVDADRARCDGPAVQDDRSGAGVGCRRGRPPPDRRPRVTTATRPATRESPTSKKPRTRAGGCGREHECLRGRDRPGERYQPVEQDAETGADDDANPGHGTAGVGRADRDRGGRTGRTADAPERRAGGAVVPGRRHDERVEAQRPVDRPRERAVGERRERLDERDERDPRRIVGVTVLVRDRPRAPDRRATGRSVRRPCSRRGRRSASRRRGSASTVAPGATPVSPAGPPAPTSRPAISVPWVSTRDGSVGFACAAASGAPPTTSTPASHVPVEVRRGASTPVSSSAIVTPRPTSPASRAPGLGASEAARRSAAGCIRGRVGDPHRVDALHPLRPLDERDRTGVEDGGESVQRPREPELRLDRDADAGEVGDELALGRGRGRRPPPLVGVAREAAGAVDAVGEREGRQHDEDALADPDRGTRTADETVPRGRRLDPRRRRRRRRAPPPAGTISTAAAAIPARTISPAPLRHRIGVQAERVGGRLGVAGGGGDHRRIVRAELERGGDCLGQRRAQLRVGGDAADDRDPPARPPRRACARRAPARSPAGTRRRGRRGARPAPAARGRAPRRAARSSAPRTRSRSPGTRATGKS